MSAMGEEELLAEMRSSLDAVRAASDRVRQQVQESRTTVRDREHLLSVTVGGNGELLELTFHGDAYRELAPAELGDLIVRTTTGAREKARRAALAEFTGLTGDLSGLGDAARDAGSVEELVEGLVGMFATGDARGHVGGGAG